MSGINKVILLGRLTRDPEVKNIGGTDITNFSIATSKKWKDDTGEMKEKAEFHNIVAFRKTAEICGKYLSKGKQVYIEGELQTSSWEKDGVKKWKTEIIANNVELLGSKQEEVAMSPTATPVGGIDKYEEIPF